MQESIQKGSPTRGGAKSVRVLVAERLTVTRYGIAAMLATARGITVSGEAADGIDALEELRRGGHDVLVCGIDLPRLQGLDLVKQARSEGIRTRSLVFSRLPEEDFALRALKAGALGYLMKDAEADELVAAVRAVAAGKRYVSASLIQSIAAQLGTGLEHEPHDLLSDRELEVMRYLALGRSVKEIAGDLSLSISTVSTYRIRLLTKMNFSKNSQLTRYAIKHGLVE